MSPPSGRAGLSRLAVFVSLLVILAAAGAYVFLTRTPPRPAQTSSAGLPTFPVQTAVDNLVQDLNNRNVGDLAALYSPNAVVIWFGSTGGLSGRYAGSQQIKLIYAASVGKTTGLDANITDFAQDTLSPTSANTTYVLHLDGNSTVAGTLLATVDVSEGWNWGGSGWQISRENWNYALFYSSYISANQSSVTTFPQWAVTKGGGNPNLVSEKSFEWHAGPFIAASVYAFVFGVVAIAAFRLAARRAGGGGLDGPGERTSDSSTPIEPSRSSSPLGRLRITSPAITMATPKAAKTSPSAR